MPSYFSSEPIEKYSAISDKSFRVLAFWPHSPPPGSRIIRYIFSRKMGDFNSRNADSSRSCHSCVCNHHRWERHALKKVGLRQQEIIEKINVNENFLNILRAVFWSDYALFSRSHRNAETDDPVISRKRGAVALKRSSKLKRKMSPRSRPSQRSVRSVRLARLSRRSVGRPASLQAQRFDTSKTRVRVTIHANKFRKAPGAGRRRLRKRLVRPRSSALRARRKKSVMATNSPSPPPEVLPDDLPLEAANDETYTPTYDEIVNAVERANPNLRMGVWD